MSSIEIRDDVANYIESVIDDEVVFPVPEVEVRKIVVPVVELEKESGYVIDVYPLTLAASREYRDDWVRTYTIRVVIRTMNASRSPSAIAAAEEAFVAFSEWLQNQLMLMRLPTSYVLSTVQDRETFVRDVYVENAMLVTVLDLELVAHG